MHTQTSRIQVLFIKNIIFFEDIVMEGYMTTKEAAERWNISQRQVQIHCKKGRIPGVTTVGTNYLIPVNATRPLYGFYSMPQGQEDK